VRLRRGGTPCSGGCVVSAITKYTLGAVEGGEKPRRRWLLRRENKRVTLRESCWSGIVYSSSEHPLSPPFHLHRHCPHTRHPYMVKTLVYISNVEGLNGGGPLKPLSRAHRGSLAFAALSPPVIPSRPADFFLSFPFYSNYRHPAAGSTRQSRATPLDSHCTHTQTTPLPPQLGGKFIHAVHCSSQRVTIALFFYHSHF